MHFIKAARRSQLPLLKPSWKVPEQDSGLSVFSTVPQLGAGKLAVTPDQGAFPPASRKGPAAPLPPDGSLPAPPLPGTQAGPLSGASAAAPPASRHTLCSGCLLRNNKPPKCRGLNTRFILLLMLGQCLERLSRAVFSTSPWCLLWPLLPGWQVCPQAGALGLFSVGRPGLSQCGPGVGSPRWLPSWGELSKGPGRAAGLRKPQMPPLPHPVG